MAELFFNLQLFAEGAGAEGGEPAQGEGAASPAAQGEIAEAPTAEEARRAAYEKFKADFEAEYKAEMQNAIKDRLKKSKAQQSELQGRLDRLAPAIDLISSKYGVDPNDIDSLVNAVENDDKLYEDEAYERGMTVEQLKAFRALERENRQMRAMQAQAQAQAAQQAQYEEWDRQFNELQQVYPGVNPAEELQNDEFIRLMNAGVPIRDVFELVHKDELMRGAMQFTAGKVAEKMSNAARVNGAHPAENGLSHRAAAVTQPNIESMSIEQLKDYGEKAKAGGQYDFVTRY